MDSQQFRHFRNFFEAFGFEPFLQNFQLAKYWIICQTLIAAIQVLVVIVNFHYILYTQDEIGMASDFMKLLLTFCSYSMAIYVSCASSHHSNVLIQINFYIHILSTLYWLIFRFFNTNFD